MTREEKTAYMREWRERNREHVREINRKASAKRRDADPQAERDRHASWRKKHLRYAKDRAKGFYSQWKNSVSIKANRKAPMDWLISLEWVREHLAAGLCEVTGLPLNTTYDGSGARHPLRPSIDRKNPNLGYTEDNCQIVCWLYNRAKGDGTHEDVMMLAEALVLKKILTRELTAKDLV